jgi:ADP-L-glycero-D-manno-heptose 6-epimerase
MLRELENRGHVVDVYEWGDIFPSVIEKDWVIHLGAITSTTERDIDRIMTQNYDFTRQLFDACKTYGVNMQYASSASVYGMGTDFKETANPDPRTPYAWSKYLCERYHRQHQGGNVVQGFRYFNVYGPEGEEHKGDQASPFYKFQQQALTHGKIRLFRGSEHYHRDFVQVSDLVETQLKFLDISQSGIWNIGSGSAQSFRQIAEQFGVPLVEIDMPDILKSSYQAYTCADMTKTMETLKLHD